MVAKLYCIASHENAVLDTTRIHLLRESLGDQRCREVVEEVVFHLTDRLTLLQKAMDEGRSAEAQALSHRLASLSDQVGLSDFARVARDLAQCLVRSDATAAAAVAARLMRIGDHSLYSVMHYADHCAV